MFDWYTHDWSNERVIWHTYSALYLQLTYYHVKYLHVWLFLKDLLGLVHVNHPPLYLGLKACKNALQVKFSQISIILKPFLKIMYKCAWSSTSQITLNDDFIGVDWLFKMEGGGYGQQRLQLYSSHTIYEIFDLTGSVCFLSVRP